MKTFTILLIIYFGAGISLYFFQDKLMFYPVSLNASHQYNFSCSHKEITLQAEKHSYNIVQFFPETALCKGVVLYFHGNMENISRYARFAPYFTKNGYEVWMADYPGFGKSTGILNEQAMYELANEMYKSATAKNFKPENIIIYGKSMGTGVAAYLAANKGCKRVILETPYYSMWSVAKYYSAGIYPIASLVQFRLPTGAYLKKVSVPVTIFHGTQDEVIPLKNSLRLKPKLKPGDEYIVINGGEHNNLYDFSLTNNKLDSLLSL